MPANWDPLNDDPDTGDNNDVAVLRLEGQVAEVRACAAGATPPADPVEGTLWVDTSGSQPALKQYLSIDGAALGWTHIGPAGRLPAGINADPSSADNRAAPHEHKALRVENVGALPAVTATNKGLLVFLTPTGEMWFADQGVSGGWKGLLSLAEAGTLDTVELDLTAAMLGATPPTAASKGATPAVRGYLFDAAAESMTLQTVVPHNYKGGADLYLDLYCALNQAELAGDDIDWSADLVAVTPGAAGGVMGKASTVVVAILQDIGANNGDGALHRCRLVLDHDNVTNPITPGDLVAVEIHRTDLAQVGGVILVAARLAFPQKPLHQRAA